MYKYFLFATVLFTSMFTACIGTDLIDDFVQPQLFFTNVQDTLVVDNEIQFTAKYRNNIGADEEVDLNWESNNATVATVDNNGLVTAKSAGSAIIKISYTANDITVEDEQAITVVIEVEPKLILTEFIDTLGIDDSFKFEAVYRSSDGELNMVNVNWESSDADIVTIDAMGNATGKTMGSATITGSYDDGNNLLSVTYNIIIEEETVVMLEQRMGTVNTTSTYDLTGDFTLTEEENGELTLSFASNYNADTGLPGLYVYLSNNASSNAPAVAYEIGRVTVFNGAHSYTIPSSIGIDQYQYVLYYCKPFSVEVGSGEIN